MGHIQPVTRKGPNGKSVTKYRARWIDPSNAERCETFGLKRDAQRKLDEVAADMLTGKYADPRAGKILVSTYAERWAASMRWEPSTREQQDMYLGKHIVPRFGDRQLGSITTTEVRGFITELTEKFPASDTPRNITITLFAIFAAAVQDKKRGDDPCGGLKLPGKSKRKVTIPTMAQVARLVAAAPPRYRVAVMLGAGSGLRQSEMTGLTLDQLVLPLGTPVFGVERGAVPAIKVDRQLACLKGKAPEIKMRPKTDAGLRTIRMAPRLADMLTAHLTEFPVKHPWGLVVTDEDDQPINRREWSRIWERIRRTAKVPGVFHHLRHYAVSNMIRQGRTPTEVMAFAGHADIKTTYNDYGHLWEDSDDLTCEALNAGLDFSRLDEQAGGLATG